MRRQFAVVQNTLIKKILCSHVFGAFVTVVLMELTIMWPFKNVTAIGLKTWAMFPLNMLVKKLLRCIVFDTISAIFVPVYAVESPFPRMVILDVSV